MRSTRLVRAGALIALLSTLCGCLPPNVYSRIPTDPEGQPLPANSLDAFELGQDFRYELEQGEELRIQPGEMTLLSAADQYGTRRIRTYPLEEVLQVRQKLEDGSHRWLECATIDDFGALDPLPRIESIVLTDGRVIALRDARAVRWSADRLALVVERHEQETQRFVLDEIDRVLLVRGNPVLATLGSWKFWAVTGAAGILTWWVSGLEDEESLATK